jgi:hypothetical protein
MLEDCLRVLGKSGTTEETVCKTLELNELKMTSQLRHLESLKASLTAADEQVWEASSAFKKSKCNLVYFRKIAL